MNPRKAFRKIVIALLAALLTACASEVSLRPARPRMCPHEAFWQRRALTPAPILEPTAPLVPTAPPTTTKDGAAPPIATVSNGGNVRSAPSTKGTVVLDRMEMWARRCCCGCTRPMVSGSRSSIHACVKIGWSWV